MPSCEKDAQWPRLIPMAVPNSERGRLSPHDGRALWTVRSQLTEATSTKRSRH